MAFSASAMESAMVGSGGVDILGQGIFETGGSAFKMPAHADTNFDTVKVGNDNANAIGIGLGLFPFSDNAGAVARNNLEVKKNQNSGDCACCQALDANAACQDCCTKYNIEQIEVGNRNARAVGIGAGVGPFSGNTGAIAENNVKIVTNQE
jgi:hypothetical protein